MSLVVRALVALLLFGWVTSSALAAPPGLSVDSTIPSGWVTGGNYSVSATATSPANLKTLTISIPTETRIKPELAKCLLCDRLTAVAEVKPAYMRDGVGEIIVVASDMDNVSASAWLEVHVDKTAPPAVGAIGLKGGEGWRAGNRFDVAWPALAPDPGSPIVAARYELCPLVGTGDCVSARRALDGGNGLDGISVPGSGAWRLQLGLEDQAGHTGLSTSTTLLLDASAPALWFTASPGDPLGVVLNAADADSGVGSMTIEARRQGDDTWRVLAAGSDNSLTARLDGETMAPGTYEIRGRGVDAVGNERTASAWLNGGSVQLLLPAKLGSTMTAGVGSGKRREMRPLVAFGKVTTIRGSVMNASGRPLAGVPVTVSERAMTPSASWRYLTTVATGRQGEFRYRAARGTARTLRFDYPGSPTARPTSAEVVLRVQASTSLTANKRRLRNGETLTLRGAVRGEPIPTTGKLVTLQARVPGGWRTFGTARARTKDGRWSYRYQFTRTPATARYTFRAVVPQEETFPYVTGSSRRLTVVVAGSE